jgi:MFS family permease
MLTYVALPYQAYRLTHSSLTVGLLSLAELGPLVLVAFVGGALADAVDRRWMVRWTEAGLCLATAGLAINSIVPNPQLWVLFVIGAVCAGLGGLQRPSLDSLVPRLVAPTEVPAAVAVNSAGGTLAQVFGPPVAGVLLATVGLGATYGIDVVTFAFSVASLARVSAVPPPPDSKGVSLKAVGEGIGYARSRQELLGTYLVDIGAMVFGMPTALFPQVAATMGGAKVLGLLYAGPGLGALLLSATSGWTARIRRYGRAVAIAAAIWGLGIIGFGLAPGLPWALGALVLAGAGDEASAIMRTAMWNLTIPDALRGRLAGIEMLSYSSGPAVGNAEAGLAEALFGLRTSIVSGGVLCVAACVGLSLALPRFRRYLAPAREIPAE